MEKHEAHIESLRGALKAQKALINEFHQYETLKEGIKEGCGDTNMRRAERKIQQIEYAFKLMYE
jgi:hypothetical protein